MDSGVLRKPVPTSVSKSWRLKANGAKVQLWDCNLGEPKWLTSRLPGPNQGPGLTTTVGLGRGGGAGVCNLSAVQIQAGGVPAGKVWHVGIPSVDVTVQNRRENG
jgi:hypothetical protein